MLKCTDYFIDVELISIKISKLTTSKVTLSNISGIKIINFFFLRFKITQSLVIV
jgi:hypothetical protein